MERHYIVWLAVAFLFISATTIAQEESQANSYSDNDKNIYELSLDHSNSNEKLVSELMSAAAIQHTPYFYLQLCEALSKTDATQINDVIEAATRSLTDQRIDQQATLLFCQQYANQIDYEQVDAELVELYQRIDLLKSLPLKMLLSHDYAYMMQERGFYEQAMEAIKLSMDIAEQNNDVLQLPNIYATTALIQSKLGLTDEALSYNQSALDLALTSWHRTPYLMERGYILIDAKRYEQAKQAYFKASELIDDSDIYATFIIKSNLATIYRSTGEIERLDELTKELMLIAEQLGEKDVATAQAFRAFSLVESGQIEAAKQMFNDSIAWLSKNYHYDAAVNLQSWSELIEEKGYIEEALAALKRSVAINAKLNESQKQEQTLFLNRLMANEKQARELQNAQNFIKLQKANIESANLKQKQFILIITFLFVTLAISGYAFFKTRRLNKALQTTNEQLDYESNHDPMTHTYNRRFFYNFLQASNDRDSKSEPILLALVDIDFFKKVNDTYGHDAGDKVLIEVTSRLKNALRNSDLVIRWGGEEFLLYIHNASNERQNCELIQRLLKETEGDPVDIGGEKIHISISVGFAVITKNGLLNQLTYIDELLYRAKQEGRKRAVGREGQDINAPEITIKSGYTPPSMPA